MTSKSAHAGGVTPVARELPWRCSELGRANLASQVSTNLNSRMSRRDVRGVGAQQLLGTVIVRFGEAEFELQALVFTRETAQLAALLAG